MLPPKACQHLSHAVMEKRDGGDGSRGVMKVATLGFLAGCMAYHVLSSLSHDGAPNVALATLHASRAHPDEDSWKCVSMYRGRPKDPNLGAEKASQVGQDATILDIFRHKRHGTFLDLAANDAIALSNSLVLEQRYEWKGICVEPNPIYAEGYLHRTCHLVQAVVGPREDVRVDFNFRGTGRVGAHGGIAGFDNKAGQSNETASHYTVPVAKILHDFGMPRTIDYMSLDIEGAEAWTFETFPWDTYTFLTITVERPKPELKDMMLANGYTHLCNHGGFGDELWVHEALPHFHEVVRKYAGRQDCRKEPRS